MNKVWIVGAVSLLLAGNTYASCKQSDAKGTWVTYQSAFIATGPHVGQCKLVVDKTGAIYEDDRSFCEFVTFNTGPIPTGGTFLVKKDCSAEIKLDLGQFNGQVQIAKGKDIYAGRFSATSQEGAVSGTTTGVKQ